ncbi:ATP-binding protein [Paenibacillus thiaminolyticus]|uniref:ATP-binding protein n=1 Tax=Paenibacillus thiaminolyticus TaxID=49283 RepID=UPI0035A62996
MIEERQDIGTYDLESLQEGIIKCDTMGVIVFMNRRLEELFGLGDMTEREITAFTKAIDAYIQEEDHKLTKRIQAFRGGDLSCNHAEFLYTRSNERLFSFYLNPVSDSAQTMCYGYLLVFRECAKEERANKLRTEMISVASHELRTPLTTLLGYVEMLMQYDISVQNRKRYMEVISAEGNRLSNLLEVFLDSEQLESGILNYHKTYVSLVELIQEVSERWNLKSSHLINVRSEVDDAFIYADRIRITQVFDNLINNAIKYTPSNEIILIRIAEEGGCYVIDVRDYGIGIPKEMHDKLFDKFFRVSNSKSHQITGSGLGLYIAKKIVTDHGGNISLTSYLGRGSTFHLRMPKPANLE